MRMRSAVVVAAVGVFCGFAAVSVRGQVINQDTPQVLSPGPGVTNPVIVRSVEPKYTSAAMHEKIQGNVELDAVVRTDGTVGDISVLKSLDQKYGLDDAAVSAAKQWVFRPGTKDGKPVNVRVILVLTFRLKSDGTPASAAATATSQAADDGFTRGAYTEFTPDLVKPRVVRQPEPKYTSDAMKAKIQGDVLIDAVVGIDGTVIRARITRSLDAQFGLDDEALRAVRQWIFEPGTLKGETVPVLVNLVLMFRLH